MTDIGVKYQNGYVYPPKQGHQIPDRKPGVYCYGGWWLGSSSTKMRRTEIKRCSSCLLTINSYEKNCPRCFANTETGDQWGDLSKPPINMRERFCSRCGTDSIGSNGIHVFNPPSGMGHQWCRDCVSEVQNGCKSKIFIPKGEKCPRCLLKNMTGLVCPDCGFIGWKNLVPGIVIFGILLSVAFLCDPGLRRWSMLGIAALFFLLPVLYHSAIAMRDSKRVHALKQLLEKSANMSVSADIENREVD